MTITHHSFIGNKINIEDKIYEKNSSARFVTMTCIVIGMSMIFLSRLK